MSHLRNYTLASIDDRRGFCSIHILVFSHVHFPKQQVAPHLLKYWTMYVHLLGESEHRNVYEVGEEKESGG